MKIAQVGKWHINTKYKEKRKTHNNLMPVSHERNRIILARNISTSENERTMAASVSSARHKLIAIYVRGGLRRNTQGVQIHYLRKIDTCLSILNCLFYTNNNDTRNYSIVLFIHSLIAKSYI